MSEITKRCSKCGSEKPLSEFHKNRSYSGGIEYMCSVCRNAYYRNNINGKMPRFLSYTLSAAKRRSKKRGLPFNLTISDIKALLVTNCPICNVVLDFSYRRAFIRQNSPSLDAIVPTKGYIVDNVAMICHKCNRQKGDLTLEDIARIANWIEAKIK